MRNPPYPDIAVPRPGGSVAISKLFHCGRLPTAFAFVLFLFLHLARAATPVEFYISTTGNDTTGVGSLANPWKTVQKARDQIYTNGLNKSTPVTIEILGGNYFFTDTLLIDSNHSGTAAAPVVYTAYNNQTVRFIGGVMVNTSSAVQTTNTIFKSEAKPHIYQINLAAQGITSLLGLTRVSSRDTRDNFAQSEIFLNGAPCTLARWPNNGFAQVAASSTTATLFQYTEDEPSINVGSTGGYVFSCFNWLWYGSTQAISGINSATKQITMAQAAPNAINQGDPYYLFNLPRELDSQGEYYLDRTGGMLYLYPPDGVNLATSELLVSTLQKPIVSFTNAAYVTLQNIQVEAGCYDAIDLNSATNCSIVSCNIKNIALRGVDMVGGSNNLVTACTISDAGTDGVAVINSGDFMTLAGGNQAITYNNIFRSGRLSQQVESAGIYIGNSVGVYIRYNSIHDVIFNAILFIGAGDLYVEYNDIYKACMYVNDAGPIYGNGEYNGCQYFRYNYIHDNGGPWNVDAIYLDVHSSNGIAFGNVVKNTGKLLSQNGGRNGTAENNIFINDRAGNRTYSIDMHTGSDSAETYCMPDYIKYVMSGGTTPNLAYNRPPYNTGNIFNISTDGIGVPKYNQAQNNVSINTNADSFDSNVILYQRTIQNSIRLNSIADAGFVDSTHNDFALSSNSPIFSLLPGFQQIPFDQIGSGNPMPAPSTHEQLDRIPPRPAIDLALNALATANSGTGSAVTLTDGDDTNGVWSTTVSNTANVVVTFPSQQTISQVEVGIQGGWTWYIKNIRVEVFDENTGAYKYWTGNHFASLPAGIDTAPLSVQENYITATAGSQTSTIFQFDQYVTTSKIRVWVLDTYYGGHINGITRISAYRGDTLGSIALNKPVTVSGNAARSTFNANALTDGVEDDYSIWDASLSQNGPPTNQLANFSVPLFEGRYFDRFLIVAASGQGKYLKNVRIEAKDSNNATIWWNGSSWVSLPISDTAPYSDQINYVSAINSGTADCLDIKTARIQSDQVRVWILDSYTDSIQLAEFGLFDSTASLLAPPNIQAPVQGANLKLHLDASAALTLITDSNSRVSRWNDADGGTNYVVQTSTSNQPAVSLDGTLGRQVVDFGPFVSGTTGQWMQFKDSTGNDLQFTTIRSVFVVMKGGNFVLGDSGSYSFHRAFDNSGNCVSGTCALLHSTYASNFLKSGTIYLNGGASPINGTTTAMPTGYWLASISSTNGVTASLLARDRTYRTGGQQLAEMLIYDRVLTDSERKATEAYLMNKWFGIDTSGLTIANLPAMTLEATGPNGATANFAVSGSDALDGTVTATTWPGTGSLFPLGTTPVNVVAESSAGFTATASFNITVRDTTPPTMIVPPSITVSPTSAAGSIVTFAVSGSDAVSGSVPVVANPPSGFLFPIGTTQVTVTGSDAAGNVGSGSFQVKVIVPAVSAAELRDVSAATSGSLFNITVRSPVAGRTFQLQRSDTLKPDSWTDLGPIQNGDNAAIILSDTMSPAVPRRFYRIRLGP